jgi:adenylate kinase family enzyme
MRKIIIIGTTGSGKTTLANSISKKLGIPHIQLDHLFWKPNWQQSTDEEFLSKIKKELSPNETWIVDGNYARTNHLTWNDADTVIWIDLPFFLTFYQNFKRSVIRAITRQELWEGTGNKESFLKMFSKDSILLWLIKTYGSNKKRYVIRISDPTYSHINFHRLCSRKEMKAFVENL